MRERGYFLAEFLLATMILLGALMVVSSAVPPLVRSWQEIVLLESQLQEGDRVLVEALSVGVVSQNILVEPVGDWGKLMTWHLMGNRKLVLLVDAE